MTNEDRLKLALQAAQQLLAEANGKVIDLSVMLAEERGKVAELQAAKQDVEPVTLSKSPRHRTMDTIG